VPDLAAENTVRIARPTSGGDPAPNPGTILYVGRTLPKLSETFVYREIFALRDLGVRVLAASVHPPERRLGDPRVDALAAEMIPVYGAGTTRLWGDAAARIAASPARALGVVGIALRDAALSRDLRMATRPRVLLQCAAGLALARRVRHMGITHVHAHMAHVPATVAMYTAAALGVPFSFTGHANDLFVNRALLREKLRRAAFVSCISHWHAAFYRGVVDVAPERLPVIRCGVEMHPPHVHAERGTVHIAAVGRLIPKKGFDVLIGAIAGIVSSRPDSKVRCTIVGEGPERERLREMVIASKLEQVVDLAGPMPNQEVQKLLAQADLFVLPCRVDEEGDKDGIPVVLMEAMARGVPVISGDLPTIRELVKHGETGLLAPPGDTGALASAIEAMIRDVGLRDQLGSRGREWVSQEFSARVNAERLVGAFARTKDPRPCAV
jgi:colanic acid/amylovoran biosynthesis glycosyltransferase